jgi:hypothetical protein
MNVRDTLLLALVILAIPATSCREDSVPTAPLSSKTVSVTPLMEFVLAVRSLTFCPLKKTLARNTQGPRTARNTTGTVVMSASLAIQRTSIFI